MTLESGAEAVGEVGGPNASVGPTPYEQGVQDGRHMQYVADHEALGHEDPVGDLLKAAAGGPHGAVHLGTDVLGDVPDLLGTSDDGSDAGASTDATIEQPDATVQHADPGDAGASGNDDGGYCSDPGYSADPGYSEQDAGAY